MNVHGIRLKFRTDQETGLPLDREGVQQAGSIKLFKLEKSGMIDDPGQYVLTVHVPWQHVPGYGDEWWLPLSQLRFDPASDVWTAPEWVDGIGLVTCEDPIKIHEVRPRPADWRPA